jgi:ribosomal protein S18 acetylase RimI-like enzyme
MEFRRECGRCRRSLREDGPAYLCAKDCTFCPTCYRQLKYACPNCAGELVRRPRPSRSPTSEREPSRSPDEAITVRRATVPDLDAIAPLFDAYRQFYEQPPDPDGSRQFLVDRLAHDESVVLVAEEGRIAVGFTQLYPLHSSVSLGPIYVLNDLFVAPRARRRGVGAKLLEAARSHGRETGCHYLELSTAVDNPAQHLYESCGWQLDREFLHYELPLRAAP